ncbi:MAG: hypothetical protein DI626_05020 [Micavibrio aeruginosavorus]|uniref:Uncharacterized protein n=1 Tax=Micavibrio aeruginosavorus TaxID=349221 RepID=A0A2W5A3K7_9BACT|nr:MAG: hypothetical protein DI626_05020 [Micavibrio aeruginosavorus]
MQATGYRKSEMSETGWVPAAAHAFNIARQPEYKTAPAPSEPEREPQHSMESAIDMPGTRGKTFDQIVLEQRSGNVLARTDLRSNVRDEEEEKEENKKQEQYRAIARFTQMNEFKFTTSNVIESLKSSIGIDNAWLKINESQPPITKNDMLRLDERGNIVSPQDDPDGKYIVTSLQQKQAYETRIGACTMFYAGEEVTMDQNGRLVLKRTLDDTTKLHGRIQDAELTIQKLERGEMTTDDLDPAMREDILARHKGEPTKLEQDMLQSAPASQNAGETVLDALTRPTPFQTQKQWTQQYTPAGM